MKKSDAGTDGWVLALSFASFVWILWYKFYFIHMPPIFEWAYEIGEIAYNFLGAVVSSGIFYFIVIDIDKKHKQSKVNEFAEKKLLFYRNAYELFLQESGFGLREKEFYRNIPQSSEIESKIKGLIYLSPEISEEGFRNLIIRSRETEKQIIDSVMSFGIDYIDKELFGLLIDLMEIKYDNIFLNENRFQRILLSRERVVYASENADAYFEYLNKLHNIYLYIDRLH